MGISSSLYVWQNSPVKHLVPIFICRECFYDIFNFIYSDRSVQLIYYFSIQFWQAVSLQKVVHFFQVVKFVGIQLFILFSHDFLYFCSIHCDFSFFISYFVYLNSFSPLLSESSRRFVNFVYLFKEPDLGFINFLYCFLNLYFIDFLFDLYDFLPSADYRFYLFFFF